jgi:hypothetical protein
MEGAVTLSPDEATGALRDMATVETRTQRGGGALILSECWFSVV